MIDGKEVERFFLEVAAKTYAADTPQMVKTTIPDLPRSKVFRYQRNGLLYVDCYFSGGYRSFGQTVIWEDDMPVWGMQYGGEWDSNDGRVIPFLKAALRQTYNGLQFYGGRGPAQFTDGTLKYRNSWQGDFAGFKGTETILDPAQGHRRIFWHTYSGMALAPALR